MNLDLKGIDMDERIECPRCGGDIYPQSARGFVKGDDGFSIMVCIRCDDKLDRNGKYPPQEVIGDKEREAAIDRWQAELEESKDSEFSRKIDAMANEHIQEIKKTKLVPSRVEARILLRTITTLYPEELQNFLQTRKGLKNGLRTRV